MGEAAERVHGLKEPCSGESNLKKKENKKKKQLWVTHVPSCHCAVVGNSAIKVIIDWNVERIQE